MKSLIKPYLNLKNIKLKISNKKYLNCYQIYIFFHFHEITKAREIQIL